MLSTQAKSTHIRKARRLVFPCCMTWRGGGSVDVLAKFSRGSGGEESDGGGSGEDLGMGLFWSCSGAVLERFWKNRPTGTQSDRPTETRLICFPSPPREVCGSQGRKWLRCGRLGVSGLGGVSGGMNTEVQGVEVLSWSPCTANA